MFTIAINFAKGRWLPLRGDWKRSDAYSARTECPHSKTSEYSWQGSLYGAVRVCRDQDIIPAKSDASGRFVNLRARPFILADSQRIAFYSWERAVLRDRFSANFRGSFSPKFAGGGPKPPPAAFCTKMAPVMVL